MQLSSVIEVVYSNKLVQIQKKKKNCQTNLLLSYTVVEASRISHCQQEIQKKKLKFSKIIWVS